MKSNKSKLFLFFIVVAALAGAAWFYLNKPNRTVTNEKGIEISASELVKEYQDNEAEANAKYLDKALQVTGTISEVSKNQEGQVTLLLSSEDPLTGVFCTVKEDVDLPIGFTVTIKGFCSGMLSDVRIREAVVVR